MRCSHLSQFYVEEHSEIVPDTVDTLICRVVNICPSFTSEKLSKMLFLYLVLLLSCCVPPGVSLWYFPHLLLSQFKPSICFVCFVVNKIWVYEIYKSLRSGFIYIVHSF